MPIVVEFSWIRSRTSVNVCCSTLGKRRCRSLTTLVSTPLIFNTWPKTKSTKSAKGKTASIRL